MCYLIIQRSFNSEELRQLRAGALPGRTPEPVRGPEGEADVGAGIPAAKGPP
jgi:hypothetical protein